VLLSWLACSPHSYHRPAPDIRAPWGIARNRTRTGDERCEIERHTCCTITIDATGCLVAVEQGHLDVHEHEIASLGFGFGESEIWVLYSSRRLLSSTIAAFVAYLDEVFPKGPP
jgi:hypothetical protein